jgi:hypothetical protein
MLIASAFLVGCVSDKECWEPDFSDRPVHDKTEKKR